MPILLRPVKLKKDEKEKYHGFKGVILIVYSDIYFDLFYDRHCARNHKIPEFTVVVIGEEEFPSKKNIKEALEQILVSKAFKLKERDRFAELPAPFFARTWSLRKEYFSDDAPAEAILRFQNCSKVSYSKLELLRNQGIISQADISC